MTDADEHGRLDPPVDGDELETLLGFLDYQRATLRWKCEGLDADALRATVGASSITLGGLLKHLAVNEEGWFTEFVLGRRPTAPFDTDDDEWIWRSAADDSPEELRAMWEGAVERARAAIAEAVADGGLGRISTMQWPDGRSPSLRWVLVHMIEEYARHNGHADLLREAIDGQTGE